MSGAIKILGFWIIVQVLANLVTDQLRQPRTWAGLVTIITHRPRPGWRFFNDFMMTGTTIFVAMCLSVDLFRFYQTKTPSALAVLPFALVAIAFAAGLLCWSVVTAEKSWTYGVCYLWLIVYFGLVYMGHLLYQ